MLPRRGVLERISKRRRVALQKKRNVFTHSGEPLSDAELKEMLAHIIVDKKGEIDWQAYIKDLMEIAPQ